MTADRATVIKLTAIGGIWPIGLLAIWFAVPGIKQNFPIELPLVVGYAVMVGLFLVLGTGQNESHS